MNAHNVNYALEMDEARFNEILEKQSRDMEIEELLKVVRENHNSEDFAKAQLTLGKLLHENGDNKAAISAWRNIKHSDNIETYAKAKGNIGFVLNKINSSEEALKVWESIQRNEYPPAYAKAQLSMGFVLEKQDNIKGALEAWHRIERSDDPESYSTARLNIGILLERIGDAIGALEAWRNIRISDNQRIFTITQFNIGLVLKKINKIEEALSIWHNIKRSDDSKFYASAQLNIGLILKDTENADGAVNAWRNIERSDYLSVYYEAQFNIGKILISVNCKKSILEAKKYFTLASESFTYESYCYAKICDLLSQDITRNIGEKYLNIFEKTLKTVNVLKIKFTQSNEKGRSFERKLAHYTSTDVADILLNKNNKKNIAGSLRLNTISNMNDPSEGRLLEVFLNDQKDMIYSALDFDERLHAFFSCFTFNHDSLNQFRLYGKKDYKEASGVSLVFDQNFFQSISLGGLSFLSVDSDSKKWIAENTNPELIDEYFVSKEQFNNRILNKKPVMRCVYIDPESGYIQLAQRNRLTFYREFGNEKTIINRSGCKLEKSLADESWEKYTLKIKRKTQVFTNLFASLKCDYKDLMNEKSKLEVKNLEALKNYETLLDEIVLPLKYLIKHSAFQEEQECRMVYITSLKDPNVKMDFGKFLYVEYEADVKAHLDKVYIGPAATQYQPYLAKLLCDSDAKIELSNNPYRQT
ncbi:hypothetical protein Q6344_02090 [Psychrobacter cibarius]|nr:hypothetical protein Q6344_02090 [Psychrobacter cibarius]